MSDDEMAFTNFLAKHGKSYATKEEYQFRFEQFQKNMGVIRAENAKNENTFSLTANKLTDYTRDEYRKLLGYKPVSAMMGENFYLDDSNLPSEIDWRA